MSFQYLHHFPTLQVPDIYFVVFTSADDVFAFSRDEAWRNTVRSVDMPRVSFDTPRVLIIPEPDRGILRRC